MCSMSSHTTAYISPISRRGQTRQLPRQHDAFFSPSLDGRHAALSASPPPHSPSLLHGSRHEHATSSIIRAATPSLDISAPHDVAGDRPTPRHTARRCHIDMRRWRQYREDKRRIEATMRAEFRMAMSPTDVADIFADYRHLSHDRH